LIRDRSWNPGGPVKAFVFWRIGILIDERICCRHDVSTDWGPGGQIGRAQYGIIVSRGTEESEAWSTRAVREIGDHWDLWCENAKNNAAAKAAAGIRSAAKSAIVHFCKRAVKVDSPSKRRVEASHHSIVRSVFVQTENRATSIRAAKLRGPIKYAVVSFDQTAERARSVSAISSEMVEHGEAAAVLVKAEDSALVEVAAGKGCAVEDSVAIAEQSASGRGSLKMIVGEVMDNTVSIAILLKFEDGAIGSSAAGRSTPKERSIARLNE